MGFALGAKDIPVEGAIGLRPPVHFMFTALAPLGAKYKLQLVPEYNADGTKVTVAVIYSLKNEKEPAIRSLTFSGTPSEIDAALAEQLPQAIEKLLAHATTLEELDQQLAAEVEKKSADAKPASAPQAKPAPPKARSASAPKSALKAGATKLPASDQTGEPPASGGNPGAVAAPSLSLTPAWKQPSAAVPIATVEPTSPAADETPSAENLGALFTEEN